MTATAIAMNMYLVKQTSEKALAVACAIRQIQRSTKHNIKQQMSSWSSSIEHKQQKKSLTNKNSWSSNLLSIPLSSELIQILGKYTDTLFEGEFNNQRGEIP